MDHVRSVARMLKSKGECDMIILDYLQLCDMKSDRNNRNREQEVAQATGRQKVMAKELDVPVLLLSQLNRTETKGVPRPLLSDLRERAIRTGCRYGDVVVSSRPAWLEYRRNIKQVSLRGAWSGDHGET